MIFPATSAAAARISIQNTRFISSPVTGAILSPSTALFGPFLTPSTPLEGDTLEPNSLLGNSFTPNTPDPGAAALLSAITIGPSGVSTTTVSGGISVVEVYVELPGGIIVVVVVVVELELLLLLDVLVVVGVDVELVVLELVYVVLLVVVGIDVELVVLELLELLSSRCLL